MITHKISMVGMHGVGKTSLVRRFVSSIFDEAYHTTLGVKVDRKALTVDGQRVNLMLWDVAGAEADFGVPMHYLRGSSGLLLVMDGTRPESLDCGLQMAEQIRAALGDLPCIPLLNKADLDWYADGATLAGKLAPLGAPALSTSARTGDNVEQAFTSLARRLLAR